MPGAHNKPLQTDEWRAAAAAFCKVVSRRSRLSGRPLCGRKGSHFCRWQATFIEKPDGAVTDKDALIDAGEDLRFRLDLQCPPLGPVADDS